MIARKDIVLKSYGIAMRTRWLLPDWSRFVVELPQAAVRLLQRWRASLRSDGYRPERHYMRGPGPKSLHRED